MSTTLYTGTIGVILRGTITDEDGDAVDVSAASVKTITVTHSSGYSRTAAASFTTDGTNGQIELATIAADLPSSGWLKWQGLVTIGSATYTTDIHSITVETSL